MLSPRSATSSLEPGDASFHRPTQTIRSPSVRTAPSSIGELITGTTIRDRSSMGPNQRPRITQTPKYPQAQRKAPEDWRTPRRFASAASTPSFGIGISLVIGIWSLGILKVLGYLTSYACASWRWR